MVLSLTDASKAGLFSVSVGSSSMSEMLGPPNAAACEEIGIFIKLKTDELSCACNVGMSPIRSMAMVIFFIRLPKIVFKDTLF